LEFGNGVGVKKPRMMVLPGRQSSFTISSAVWIECMNVTDRQRATAKAALMHSVAR